MKLDNLPDGRISPRTVVASCSDGAKNGVIIALKQLVVQYASSCVAAGANNSLRDRSILAQIRAIVLKPTTAMHSVLHFVGVKLPGLVKQMHGSGIVPVTLSLDILMDLAVHSEGSVRRAFMAAMTDMLRFPSSQTSVFSIALLFIFAESAGPSISLKEEITRTLVARLIADPPHPWGVLATFSELVKNPRFAFWKQEFVKGETETLLRRVAVLCFNKEQEQVGPSTLLQQIVDQQRR